MNIKIGIVLPTRGMIFTQVEEALERERQGYDCRIYRSHDLVIPDGHNQLAQKALDDGCTHIWMVEEDTVPPAGALAYLLKVDSDISCIDYGVSGWGCVTKDANGEILWCGLGCTLIKRKVFEALEYPYFRADKQLVLPEAMYEGSYWQDLPESYIKLNQYGSLDIWFCDQARRIGFKITQVEGECDHLNLISLGRRETNHGLHVIELKPKIERKQVL